MGSHPVPQAELGLEAVFLAQPLRCSGYSPVLHILLLSHLLSQHLLSLCVTEKLLSLY